MKTHKYPNHKQFKKAPSMKQTKASLRQAITWLLKNDSVENAVSLAQLRGYQMSLGNGAFTGQNVQIYTDVKESPFSDSFIGKSTYTGLWHIICTQTGVGIGDGRTSHNQVLAGATYQNITEEQLEKGRARFIADNGTVSQADLMATLIQEVEDGKHG